MPFNFGCDRDGLLVFVDVAVNILKKMKRKTLKVTEHRFLKRKTCGHCIFCSPTYARVCSSNLGHETTFPIMYDFESLLIHC